MIAALDDGARHRPAVRRHAGAARGPARSGAGPDEALDMLLRRRPPARATRHHRAAAAQLPDRAGHRRRYRRGDPADLDRRGHPPLRAGRVHAVRHQRHRRASGQDQDRRPSVGPSVAAPGRCRWTTRGRSPPAECRRRDPSIWATPRSTATAARAAPWSTGKATSAAGVQVTCRAASFCPPTRRAARALVVLGREAQEGTVRRRESARRAPAYRRPALPRDRRAWSRRASSSASTSTTPPSSRRPRALELFNREGLDEINIAAERACRRRSSLPPSRSA